jgi:DNA relaxase NicK
MSISATIDWLSFTHKPLKGSKVQFHGVTNDRQEIAAKFGYSDAVLFDTGLIKMWSSKREDMGQHFIYSGSCLAGLAGSGVSCMAILDRALKAGAKVTRLDLALDLVGRDIDITSIAKDINDGKCTGTARTWEHIVSANKGETLYIGSRQSERFARLYNKAAQTHLDDVAWFRLEVELKGDTAKTYARVINTQTLLSLGDYVWSTLKSMCECDNPSLSAFSEHTDTVGLPKIERVTDTERWIIEQVCPAIERFFREHPGSPAYDKLIAALGRSFREKAS